MNICLINNFNYGAYLGECLDSVLQQSRPFDLIIVVDDGSTDNSRSVLAGYKKENVITIEKENGGQLSAFNCAAKHIPFDAQVFFLDSDDIYPKDYLELWCSFTKKGSRNFTYCKSIRFGADDTRLTSSLIESAPNIEIGTTSSITLFFNYWIGAPTSCISISGGLFHKLLPYGDERNWKVRADDVIVFGSSILGENKTYVPALAINYRVHSKNNTFEEKRSKDKKKAYRAALETLMASYAEKAGIKRYPSPIDTYREIKGLSSEAGRTVNVPSGVRLLRKLCVAFIRHR